jgi:hypothetical protein
VKLNEWSGFFLLLIKETLDKGYFLRIKEQIGEKSGRVGTHNNVDYLLKHFHQATNTCMLQNKNSRF